MKFIQILLLLLFVSCSDGSMTGTEEESSITSPQPEDPSVVSDIEQSIGAIKTAVFDLDDIDSDK